LFPDQPKLREQLLTVVSRNGRLERKDGMSFIDWANATAGCVSLLHRPALPASNKPAPPVIVPIDPVLPALANTYCNHWYMYERDW
jgi:hypothetical protein